MSSRMRTAQRSGRDEDLVGVEPPATHARHRREPARRCRRRGRAPSSSPRATAVPQPDDLAARQGIERRRRQLEARDASRPVSGGSSRSAGTAARQLGADVRRVDGHPPRGTARWRCASARRGRRRCRAPRRGRARAPGRTCRRSSGRRGRRPVAPGRSRPSSTSSRCVDRDRPGPQLGLLAAAGQLVRAPAADVDRRVVGRHLLDRPPEPVERGLDGRAIERRGRRAASARRRGRRSSSVAPNATVAR